MPNNNNAIIGDEVWDALNAFDPNKALGLDDFSTHIYKHVGQ